MKLKELTILTILTVAVSCSDHSSASFMDIATPEPTAQMARLNNKPLEELIEGRRVYETSCVKCHQNRLPNTVDLPEWHKKVHTMSEKASLSSQEEESLQSYLEIFASR